MADLLVIDADAAIRVASSDGFGNLTGSWELLAPRLLWTECSSVLHRAVSRRAVGDGYERELFDRILGAPIRLIDAYDHGMPWDIASLVGWRKTYDAEYLAAARNVGAAIFTFDKQMIDGARRLGIDVVSPDHAG
jgi:predicted nucleic acid-binding protein